MRKDAVDTACAGGLRGGFNQFFKGLEASKILWFAPDGPLHYLAGEPAPPYPQVDSRLWSTARVQGQCWEPHALRCGREGFLACPNTHTAVRLPATQIRQGYTSRVSHAMIASRVLTTDGSKDGRTDLPVDSAQDQ